MARPTQGEIRKTQGRFEIDEGHKVWIKGTLDVFCCGEWLSCEGFTNTCGTCGADYNWSGHKLAPRSQWGEETGETAADILMGCSDDEF